MKSGTDILIQIAFAPFYIAFLVLKALFIFFIDILQATRKGLIRILSGILVLFVISLVIYLLNR